MFVEGRLGGIYRIKYPSEDKLSRSTGLVIEGEAQQPCISRRVAGIWCIWFLRFLSIEWFDERERQDGPAHQLDRL